MAGDRPKHTPNEARLFKGDRSSTKGQAVGEIIRRGRSHDMPATSDSQTQTHTKTTEIIRGRSIDYTRLNILLDKHTSEVQDAFIKNFSGNDAALIRNLQTAEEVIGPYKRIFSDFSPRMQKLVLGLEQGRDIDGKTVDFLLQSFERDTRKAFNKELASTRREFLNGLSEPLQKYLLQEVRQSTSRTPVETSIVTLQHLKPEELKHFLSQGEIVQIHMLEQAKHHTYTFSELLRETSTLSRGQEKTWRSLPAEVQCSIITGVPNYDYHAYYDKKVDTHTQSLVKEFRDLPRAQQSAIRELPPDIQALLFERPGRILETLEKVAAISPYAQEELSRLPMQVRHRLLAEDSSSFSNKITKVTEVFTFEPMLREQGLAQLQLDNQYQALDLERGSLYLYLCKIADASAQTQKILNTCHPEQQRVIYALPASQIDMAATVLQAHQNRLEEQCMMLHHRGIPYGRHSIVRQQQTEVIFTGAIRAVEQRIPAIAEAAGNEKLYEDLLVNKGNESQPLENLQNLWQDQTYSALREQRKPAPGSQEAKQFSQAVGEFITVNIQDHKQVERFLTDDKAGLVTRITRQEAENAESLFPTKIRVYGNERDMNGIRWQGKYYPWQEEKVRYN